MNKKKPGVNKGPKAGGGKKDTKKITKKYEGY